MFLLILRMMKVLFIKILLDEFVYKVVLINFTNLRNKSLEALGFQKPKNSFFFMEIRTARMPRWGGLPSNLRIMSKKWFNLFFISKVSKICFCQDGNWKKFENTKGFIFSKLNKSGFNVFVSNDKWFESATLYSDKSTSRLKF